MKKILLFSAILMILAGIGLSAEESVSESLKPEHKNKNWEQISLDMLVGEIERNAAEQELKDFQVMLKENKISIIYRDLLFPPDSSEITDETAVKITKLSEILKRFSGMFLIVEGHTAKVAGQDDDGTRLSFERSAAVVNALANTGHFKSEQMKAYGMGEYSPVADNDNEAGKILNRRVEISITDRLGEKTVRTKADAGDSLWWKILTDIEVPGHMIYVFDNEDLTVEDVKSIFSNRGISDFYAQETSEGLVVAFGDVSFKPGTTKPDKKTLKLIDTINEKLPINQQTQVRIGGRGNNMSDEDVDMARYNVGNYIASKTDILPWNTLVGDTPHAFSYNGNCLGSGNFVDSLEVAIIETNPLARYREFSTFGIGLGSNITFRIPPFADNAWLSPLRVGLGLNGMWHLPDQTSSVELMLETEWDLSVGYRFAFTEFFIFTPWLAYGGTVHILTDTKQTGVNQKGGFYYSQTASVKADFEFSPEDWVLGNNHRVGIFIQPGYRMFFEKDYLGHSIFVKLGGRLYI